MRTVSSLSLGLGVLALVCAATPTAAQTPTITVGGLGYLQYGYQFHRDSVLKGHQNNFDVTRAYINVVAKLPNGIYARITPDIDGRKAAAGQLSFRLKYAYIAWTPEKSALTYKIGEIHTPWLDWEEALWDYRMQGQMAIERGGYLSSSDFGAGIDGKWHYDKFNMQIGVYNGENYSGTPGDQRKDVMGRFSYKIANSNLPGRVGGLRLTAYGQYGKPTTGGERYRAIGMLSYKSTRFTLAGEYGWARDSIAGDGAAATVPAVAEKTGRVLSFFGVVNIPNSQLALIGRFDMTDPNTDSAAKGDRVSRIIGGASYQLTPNVRLLADIDNAWRQGGKYPNAFNATRTTGFFQTQVSF